MTFRVGRPNSTNISHRDLASDTFTPRKGNTSWMHSRVRHVYPFPDRTLRYVSFFEDRISCASKRDAARRDPRHFGIVFYTKVLAPFQPSLASALPFSSFTFPAFYLPVNLSPQSAKESLLSRDATLYVNTLRPRSGRDKLRAT